MVARLKPLSLEQPTSDARAAHAARTTSASTMQGNTGGESEAERAMSDESRDRRHKSWWAFAHDVMQFLYNIVPEAVGHARRGRPKAPWTVGMSSCTNVGADPPLRLFLWAPLSMLMRPLRWRGPGPRLTVLTRKALTEVQLRSSVVQFLNNFD